MAVTITDIAKKVGMSPSTVSLALRGKKAGKKSISPKTVKRIQRIAKEMGYRPNMTARSLRNRKTYTVGVLQGGFHGGFSDMRLDGINEVLNPAYSSIVATHKYDGHQERLHLNSFIDSRLDGVIASPTGDPKSNELYREMKEVYGIPLVFLDRRIAGLQLPLVATDAIEFTYQATKSLIELRHRQIVFASQLFPKETTDGNREGYRRAMREAGYEKYISIIMLERVGHITSDWAECEAAAVEVIDKYRDGIRDITAILLPFDEIAYHVLDICDEYEIKVPDDLSIMGLGDSISSSLGRINLSTVAEDLEIMGKKAAQLMLNILDGKPEKNQQFLYPGKIKLRSTTRAL